GAEAQKLVGQSLRLRYSIGVAYMLPWYDLPCPNSVTGTTAMFRLHSCWTCLTSVVVLVGAAASPIHADDLSLAEAFATTAKFQGGAYRVGRNLLERQGKKIVPYLREQTKSADWQERDLARALLLHIEQPELAAACQRLQHDRKVWRDHKVILRDDGKVAI